MKRFVVVAAAAGLVLAACGRKKEVVETPRGKVLGEVQLSKSTAERWQLEAASNCVQIVEYTNKSRALEISNGACVKDTLAKVAVETLPLYPVTFNLNWKNEQNVVLVTKGHDLTGASNAPVAMLLGSKVVGALCSNVDANHDLSLVCSVKAEKGVLKSIVIKDATRTSAALKDNLIANKVVIKGEDFEPALRPVATPKTPRVPSGRTEDAPKALPPVAGEPPLAPPIATPEKGRDDKGNSTVPGKKGDQPKPEKQQKEPGAPDRS